MRAPLSLAVLTALAAAALAIPASDAHAADCRLSQNAALAECLNNRDNLQSNRSGDVRGTDRASESLQFGNNPGNDQNMTNRGNSTRGNGNSRNNLRTNRSGDLRGGNRSNEVQQINDANQLIPGSRQGGGRNTLRTRGRGH